MTALLLGALASTPQAALACSGRVDSFEEIDLIFAGRVVDMELASDPNDTNAFAAVWVTFEVDRYLLGDGPRQLRTLDPVSVAFMDGQTPGQRQALHDPTYMGPAGACGALDEDPRAQYWVTGVSIDDQWPASDGPAPVLNRILLWDLGSIGVGPDDPYILERLAELESRLEEAGVAPAVVGHGPLEGSRGDGTALLAGGALFVLLLVSRRITAR